MDRAPADRAAGNRHFAQESRDRRPSQNAEARGEEGGSGGGASERARTAKGRRGRAKQLSSLGRQNRRRALLASRHHAVVSRTKRTAAEEHPRRLWPPKMHRVRPGQHRMPLGCSTGISAARGLGFYPGSSLLRDHDANASTRCASLSYETNGLAADYASVQSGPGAVKRASPV